jgi:hypothetical protein
LRAALEILCEEFRLSDEIKVHKKRTKRKGRRQTKINKISTKIDEIKISNNNNKQEKIITRRRTSSCCSCLCHYCDERLNSLSIIHSTSLVKFHSCPSLLFTSESIRKPSDEVIHTKPIPLSSSLETLFSSISTRECVCHEKNLGK